MVSEGDTGPSAADVREHAWEVAPGVLCLGPAGRTQTNVYFVDAGSGWVLIDAGWEADAPRIERAAARLTGGGARPRAILLTHCHPDHAGAARDLAREWGVTVYMHPAEMPIALGDYDVMRAVAGPLDRWLVLPLMRAMGMRRRDRLLARSSLAGVATSLHPGADAPGLPGWRCIHTPGHTPGHVAYFRPSDGVLVSGDALVTLRVNTLGGLLGRQGLSGPPWYTSWDRRRSRASIERLADLGPRVVAGGHGWPMSGAGTADGLREFARRAQKAQPASYR